MSFNFYDVSTPQAIRDTLDTLWSRLQDVSDLAQRLDLSQLDQDDKGELERISRITCGYAHMIMEMGAVIDADLEDEGGTIGSLAQLFPVVAAHCQDSATALSTVLRMQAQKINRPAPVRVC